MENTPLPNDAGATGANRSLHTDAPGAVCLCPACRSAQTVSGQARIAAFNFLADSLSGNHPIHVACTWCGVPTEPTKMILGGKGLICRNCIGEAEDRIEAEGYESPSRSLQATSPATPSRCVDRRADYAAATTVPVRTGIDSEAHELRIRLQKAYAIIKTMGELAQTALRDTGSATALLTCSVRLAEAVSNGNRDAIDLAHTRADVTNDRVLDEIDAGHREKRDKEQA